MKTKSNMKRHLTNQLDQIDVPNSLYAFAEKVPTIEAHLHKQPKPAKALWKRRWFSGGIGAVAASIILISGFSSPAMANFLEKVPFLKLESNQDFSLNFPAVIDAARNNQFTPIGETAVDNGVSLTITDAFYDGSKVMLSYQIDTENAEYMGYMDPIIGQLYVNGEKARNWGSKQDARKVGNEYVGAAEIYLPEEQAGVDTLKAEIVFKKVGATEGKWKFTLDLQK